jgi:hypothetical protein
MDQRTTTWRAFLPVHPAAELFPLMSESELRELADDIAKNGLREKVAVYKGSVLDGRNRLDALELVGQPWDNILVKVGECPIHDGPNFDPYAYVISKNIKRRHLTTEQRRELIANVLKAKPEKSNRQIAAELNRSHVTVGAVRGELESTGQIDQLKKTKGKDGKERPARKPKAEPQTFYSPHLAPAKPISKNDYKLLRDSWLMLKAQMSAGTLTRHALETHREIVERVLERLSP